MYLLPIDNPQVLDLRRQLRQQHTKHRVSVHPGCNGVAAAAQHGAQQNRTEQNRTEQNRTEQNRTEQNITEQNRTEQNRTEQNKTEQNRTKQNKTKQNQTEPNRTEQNRTKQNKTKQNKTEQNRTDCTSPPSQTRTRTRRWISHPMGCNGGGETAATPAWTQRQARAAGTDSHHVWIPPVSWHMG